VSCPKNLPSRVRKAEKRKPAACVLPACCGAVVAMPFQNWKFNPVFLLTYLNTFISLVQYSRITQEAAGSLPSARRKERLRLQAAARALPKYFGPRFWIKAKALGQRSAAWGRLQARGIASPIALGRSRRWQLAEALQHVFRLTAICSKAEKRGFADSPCSQATGLEGKGEKGHPAPALERIPAGREGEKTRARAFGLSRAKPQRHLGICARAGSCCGHLSVKTSLSIQPGPARTPLVAVPSRGPPCRCPVARKKRWPLAGRAPASLPHGNA